MSMRKCPVSEVISEVSARKGRRRACAVGVAGPVPPARRRGSARPGGAQPPRGSERVPRGPADPYRTRPAPPAFASADFEDDFGDGTLTHGHYESRIGGPGRCRAAQPPWAVGGGCEPVRALRSLPGVLPDVL